MKIAWLVFVVGLLLLYILDSAFKIYEINLEMLIHNLVRFIAGFVVLGIWVLNKKTLKLKVSLYLILVLLVADDIFDYTRNIDNLTPEMIMHDIFIVFWGTVVGFFYSRAYRKKD